jgi:ABC-2 type transport system permease protein
MFIQTVVSNKFLGHGIVIGTFVLQTVLFNFGWENTLYLPGAVPPYIYSDMNGYGHFVPAMTWAIVYWFSIFAVLGVISIALTRRGAEDGLRARTRLALGARRRSRSSRGFCCSPSAPAAGSITTRTCSTST